MQIAPVNIVMKPDLKVSVLMNDLMLSTSFCVNGFQDTLLAPTLKVDGTWNLTSNGFKSQKSLSVNIHHTGQDHWCKLMIVSMYLTVT